MKEKLLDVIAREMQEGAVIIDGKGIILYANPFFKRTFSIDYPVEGIKFFEVVGDPVLVTNVDLVLCADDRQPREITIQGNQGQVLDLRLIPFSEDGLTGVIGFFRDVSEEKRVEAIKRDFVANVSHELRTPLAGIKGYAETLLDGGMEDKSVLRNFLTIIDRHANRMTTLIEDLLTLSLLESHQIPLKFEPIDMEGMITTVIQGFEKQATDKGIELIFECGVRSAECGMKGSRPEKNTVMVMGDRVRLEQVMINLVDNAIKYTNKGFIRVSARYLNGMLQIDVEDSGIGIPDKDIPRIFERFYRVDKGRSRELGGTGLGLAIVKHIIQGHNGRIWVNSKTGKGTTFSFLLPAGAVPSGN